MRGTAERGIVALHPRVLEDCMGCPVHIWLPAMAAMAPLARVARDRARALWSRPEALPERRTRVVQRFAPVGAASHTPAPEPERAS